MPKLGEVSHNFLKELINKKIHVDSVNFPDLYVEGTLLSYDEFTIIISVMEQEKRKMIMFFKHAIESIKEA